jgi:hypothetical protein
MERIRLANPTRKIKRLCEEKSVDLEKPEGGTTGEQLLPIETGFALSDARFCSPWPVDKKSDAMAKNSEGERERKREDRSRLREKNLAGCAPGWRWQK